MISYLRPFILVHVSLTALNTEAAAWKRPAAMVTSSSADVGQSGPWKRRRMTQVKDANGNPVLNSNGKPKMSAEEPSSTAELDFDKAKKTWAETLYNPEIASTVEPAVWARMPGTMQVCNPPGRLHVST